MVVAPRQELIEDYLARASTYHDPGERYGLAENEMWYWSMLAQGYTDEFAAIEMGLRPREFRQVRDSTFEKLTVLTSAQAAALYSETHWSPFLQDTIGLPDVALPSVEKLAEGLSRKNIEIETGLSASTVRRHLDVTYEIVGSLFPDRDVELTTIGLQLSGSFVPGSEREQYLNGKL